MPASPKNYDYKSAAYALSEEQAWARETAEMNKGFLDVGKRIEETRGSLQRLTAQVKSADEIFTRVLENYRQPRRGYLSSLSARNKFVLLLGVPAFIAGGLVVLFEALFR